MKHIGLNLLRVALLAGMTTWAGMLVLEVGSAESNAEAKALHASLVARTTACREPGKSTVTANALQRQHREWRRTALKVVPLQTAGTFAIVGSIPANSLIDLGVTNPEYGNRQPRVLIRSGTNGIQWASLRRFYSTPPTEADLAAALEAGE